MSEEKDEVICLAHTSVNCSKRNERSYGVARGCNLGEGTGDPFTSTCQWRHVIKDPQKPAEVAEEGSGI